MISSHNLSDITLAVKTLIILYPIYCSSTRANYHYALRSVKQREQMCKETKIISSLLNNNVTDFWKLINRSKRNSVSLPDQMDGVKGYKDMNNLFTEKYKTLFSSVSYDNSDK